MNELPPPPPLLLDPTHPANDNYTQAVNAMEKAIEAHEKDMKWQYIKIASYRAGGDNATEIAEKVHMKPPTVRMVLRRPEIMHLVEMREQLRQVKEGPSIEQRRNFLWRIAINNKDIEPRVSISAVAEMNRMSTPSFMIDGVSPTQIVINSNLLPMTTLDD